MVKRTKVILFGSQDDPKVKKSAAKIKKAGRNVETQANSHPDGTGPCGKLCSCEKECMDAIAFSGDKGASMGTSF